MINIEEARKLWIETVYHDLKDKFSHYRLTAIASCRN